MAITPDIGKLENEIRQLERELDEAREVRKKHILALELTDAKTSNDVCISLEGKIKRRTTKLNTLRLAAIREMN